MSKLLEYNENGLIVLKNIIHKRDIDTLLNVFVSILNQYLDKKLKNITSFNSKHLNESLAALRKKDLPKFGHFYETLKSSSEIQKIFFKHKITKTISNFLKTENNFLSYSGFMLRMDSFFDSRNSLDYHRDRFFYNFDNDIRSGLVAVIPLHKINKSNGSLKYITSSHKDNYSSMQNKNSKSKFSTSQKTEKPSKEKIKLYQKDLSADVGDLVLFNLNLLHSSGINQSEKFRFTMIQRFHNIASIGYKPMQIGYKKIF